MAFEEALVTPPYEAVDKLLGQLLVGGETFETIERQTGNPLEAATVITTLVTGTFTHGLYKEFGPRQGKHEEALYLSRLHRTAKKRCSELYSELKDEEPTISKEELNHDRELLMLNGIRRGVHRAMVEANNRTV